MWFDESFMVQRGAAKGVAGKTHHLSEERQGRYHYVYGPYAEPVLRIEPGDVIVAETLDAFEGRLRTEADRPTRILNFPFLNPQCGPIFVEGAEKGDVLAVRIVSIEPRGEQPAGTTALLPEFGGLVGTAHTALLNDPLPERVKKMHVSRDGIRFNDRITLPYQPFIGTLGTSPEIEAVTSLQPDYWGGNMDLPDVGEGAIAYFPVQCSGAFLYLGDCHATQGDGELCGVAVEIASTTTVQVDLDQALEDRLAAPRERGLHHDDRLGPTDGGRGPHRLPRTGSMARSGLRMGPAGSLSLSHASRPHPARQHGRPEIHPGCLGPAGIPSMKADRHEPPQPRPGCRRTLRPHRICAAKDSTGAGDSEDPG